MADGEGVEEAEFECRGCKKIWKDQSKEDDWKNVIVPLVNDLGELNAVFLRVLLTLTLPTTFHLQSSRCLNPIPTGPEPVLRRKLAQC